MFQISPLLKISINLGRVLDHDNDFTLKPLKLELVLALKIGEFHHVILSFCEVLQCGRGFDGIDVSGAHAGPSLKPPQL